MKNNNLFVDPLRNMSSCELEYYASVARSREIMNSQLLREKEILKEYKCKNIPVLRHLRSHAEEIQLLFANVRDCHHDLYGDGTGMSFVLHENTVTHELTAIKVTLDFKNDVVTILAGGEDRTASMKELVSYVKAKKPSDYTWKLLSAANGVIKYKVSWIGRKVAARHIAEEEEYGYEMAQKYLGGVFGL